MARIREALRRADSMRSQPPPSTSAPRPYEADERAFAEIEEEVPFIEIGGREAAVEASPSVLAGGPKNNRAVSAERQALEPPLVPSALRAAVRVPRSPAAAVELTGVSFRPFPLEFPRAQAQFARDLIALHQPEHPVSEQYRGLMKNLEKQLSPGPSHVVLFSSASPHTDPIPVLLNLALSVAAHDAAPAIVIDANLQRPTLAEQLIVPSAPGLGDVLAGRLSLPCAIQNTGHANLHVLTAGKTAYETTPLADDDAMRAVLRQLRGRFVWIFVNACCGDGPLNAIGMGTACDAIYLIVTERDMNTKAVEELSQLIVQRGGCLRGYVLVSSR
jgi:Mrp family chromosome partitioning ATPase